MLFIPRPPQARCEGGYSFLLAKHRLTPSTPGRMMRPIYTHPRPTLLPYSIEKKGKGGKREKKTPSLFGPAHLDVMAVTLFSSRYAPILQLWTISLRCARVLTNSLGALSPDSAPLSSDSALRALRERFLADCTSDQGNSLIPPFRSTLADNSLLKTAPYDSTAGHFP